MDSKALETLEACKSVVVKTPAGRQQAADMWDAIRAFRKQREAMKEDECRPLKKAWDDAKKPHDEFIKECAEVEGKLQGAMSEWDREQDRLARIEQAKIQTKIDAENAKKLAKAEEKGKDVSEIVMKVAPVVQAPPRSIETQAGTMQTRQVKKVYTPTNHATLMRDFPQLFDLSMPKFNALAKTGLLDGRDDAKVSEEYIYAQRR